MGSPKFCGNSFSHRRAHNIEYMVLALPGDFEAAHADVYKPPYPFYTDMDKSRRKWCKKRCMENVRF